MSQTLVSAWTAARGRLEAAGVETPAFDARLLIEAGAGVTRMDILTDPYRALTEAQRDAIEKFIARRAAREPVAQILGKKHFWKYEFTITPAVLTPRPETELLVDQALAMAPPDARLLDLGTGSGAIAIAFLKERPLARAVAVDRSEEALAVARFNAHALHVSERIELREADWGAGLPDRSFDIVVSNPPYVRAGAVDLLAPEVARFEPRAALDGGQDGLDAYRALAPQIARLAKPGAPFLLELGAGQAEAVWAHCDAAGLKPEGVREDLAQIPRVLYGRAPG